MKKFLFVLIWIMPIFLFGQPYQKQNMSLQARITGQPGTYLTDIWGYELDGNEYAVVGSRAAINIYNVTDCANPVLDTALVDGFSSSWRDFKVFGGYAYGVCDGADCGLQIIKLTPDEAPTPGQQYKLTTDNTLVRAHNVFVDVYNSRLYAVGTRVVAGGARNNILIYDLSNPSSPSLIKTFETKYTHDIYVENNIGYCSHGNDYLLGIYDFSDVNNIDTLGTSEPTIGYNHSGWKHPYEDIFYVAEEIPIGRSIYIFDIADLTNPQWSEVHKIKEPLEADPNNRAHNPFVHGDLLFVSYYHDGLQVWDVTDPYDAIRVAYFDTYYQNDGGLYEGYHGAWGTYPYLSSGCLLVSDIENGFFTLRMDSHPLTAKVSDGDIYIEEPGAGVVFLNNEGEYDKMYSSGGNLIFANAVSPSENDIQLKNSHVTLATNSGIIFKDATNGNNYRLSVVNGTPLLLILPSVGNKNLLKITQGDLYLTRKNAGLIYSSSGACHKVYTDVDGKLRTVTTPCPVD